MKEWKGDKWKMGKWSGKEKKWKGRGADERKTYLQRCQEQNMQRQGNIAFKRVLVQESSSYSALHNLEFIFPYKQWQQLMRASFPGNDHKYPLHWLTLVIIVYNIDNTLGTVLSTSVQFLLYSSQSFQGKYNYCFHFIDEISEDKLFA